MVDEMPPPPPPKKPLQLTAEGFDFPDDVLQAWVDIPADEPLVIGPLTKIELDNLLFASARTSNAIFHLQQALIHYSHGEIEAADASLTESGNANIAGQTLLRKFYFAIMKSALQVRNGSK